MTKTEILAMFVAKNDPREWTLKPFRIGFFVYATNAHWAVRLPADGLEADDSIASNIKNKIEAMFEAAPADGFVPLPKVEDPGACNWCGGHGVGALHECDSCDGKGTFMRNGYKYECQSCDEEGSIFSADKDGKSVCPYCSGLGIPEDCGITKIGNATYANRYLWLLSNLPGIEIAPDQPGKPARIRFDGGDGALMPCRDDS